MVLLVAALGLNLWLLTLGVPLLLGPRPAPLLLAFGAAPLLLLFLLRRPRHRLARPGLLLGVPLLSFLPVADGPLADPALHPRPVVALQVGVLLGYLGALGRVLVPRGDGHVRITALPDQPVPLHWRRRIWLYRFLTLLSAAAPALLLYAIHLHPATQRALRLSFGTPDRVSAVQASFTAAAALLWAVAFHCFVAGPLRAHLLQDRRTQEELQALRAAARRGRPRRECYIAMLLALGSMVLLIQRSLRP